MENYFRTIYQKIAIIASLVCILFLLIIMVGEGITPDWKNYQNEFKKISVSKAKTRKQKIAANNFTIEIKQIMLKDFNRVDRCVTCHNGIDDKNMADQKNPHKNHIGDYLKNHPVEKFGCTICHGGQGRSLSLKVAFGREKDMHWETPVLQLEITQSSCGKCHISVFDSKKTLAGAEIIIKGRDLFLANNCLSCHKVRSSGGSVGPELTKQGAKSKHAYHFGNIKGEHTVQNWLKEHFIDPQRVSHGSTMPKLVLNDGDMNALITYIMSLYPPDYPVKYISLNSISEFKGKRKIFLGEDGYKLYCASCHGDKGEGKNYRVFKASVPALNSEDFLSMASEDMIRFSIEKGRSGRPMSRWDSDGGNLNKEEIDSIVEYILKWKKAAPTFASVMAAAGDAASGKIIYRSRCGTCHGSSGEGAIGPKLNSQNFLSIAPGKYIYTTIVKGRKNTAMPSWSHLSKNEISSLIKYIKKWQTVASVNLSNKKIHGDIQEGKLMFDTMCSQCHGRYGQGSVGPGILNSDFVNSVSDEFIFRSVSFGREGSAMRGWINSAQGYASLKKSKINNIVAYIRSTTVDKKDKYIYSNIVAGSPTKGKVLFKGMCASCHGWKGEGIHGPALNNQEFLNSATNGFLQGTIALGRTNTAMRSWAKGAQGYSELNEIEINDIISYIRTWQKSKIKK